jgi:hypothetical protein
MPAPGCNQGKISCQVGSILILATSQDKFLLPGGLTILDSAWHPQKLDVFFDSGAYHFALIDKSFTQSLNIPLKQLPVLQVLYLADKMLVCACPVFFQTAYLPLCIGGHQEQLSFFVAPLSQKQMC